MKRRAAAAPALGVLVVVELVAPGWRGAPDDGIDRFAPGTPERAAAAAAHEVAWLLVDHPVQRAFYRRASVREVRRIPGHCDDYGRDRVESPERFEYAARVRFYTVFDIPVRSVMATCGAMQVGPGPWPRSRAGQSAP